MSNMSNVKVSRVDNRYIHGQVNARLVREFSISKVVMISDMYAKDPFMSQLYKSIAIGYSVDILTIQQAVEAWNSGVYQCESVMLLWGNIKDAYETYRAGLKYEFVSLANIPGDVGRVQVSPTCFINEVEADQLNSLEADGVEVFFQAMPDFPKVTLKEAQEKLQF